MKIKMRNFKYFIEGKTYEKYIVPDVFIDKGYFILNKFGRYKLKVTGVSNFDGDNYIFLPKGYSSELEKENEFKPIASLLISSIENYIGQILLKSEEFDLIDIKQENIRVNQLIKWLLLDYVKNGYYSSIDSVNSVNNNGFIDWKKTIKSELPTYVNGQFLYLNVVNRKNTVNSNSIISQIHKQIIYDLSESYGWILNIQSRVRKINLNISIDSQLIILKKRLRESFITKEVKLLKKMIEYLEEHKYKSAEFILITPYYEKIWEVMLQGLFEHEKKLQLDVPRPYWVVGNSKKYTNQIPDILIKNDNELFIMDAKYYSVENSSMNSLPGWDAIVKQLYYSLALSNEAYKELYNIFLLPGHSKNIIEYFGYTSIEDKERKLGYVQAYILDIETILRIYVKKNDSSLLFMDLLEQIKAMNKKINLK